MKEKVTQNTCNNKLTLKTKRKQLKILDRELDAMDDVQKLHYMHRVKQTQEERERKEQMMEEEEVGRKHMVQYRVLHKDLVYREMQFTKVRVQV